MRDFGNDPSEGCFSSAGRAGEDDRWQTIRFDRTTQQFAGSKDVFLTDKFIERARADARGERCSACCRFDVFLCLEQIVHAQKYGALVMQAIVPARFGVPRSRGPLTTV